MIEAFAKSFGIDLADGTNVPGVMGSLEMLARGEGEFPEKLMEEAPGIFSPLRDAYMLAHSVAPAELVAEVPAEPVIETMPEVAQENPEAAPEASM